MGRFKNKWFWAVGLRILSGLFVLSVFLVRCAGIVPV
jgi:hypothetical protein